MKYQPMIYQVFTWRMKKYLKPYWEDPDGLFRKAKPIYQDLLGRMEGVSDENPMGSNITMAFVFLAVWLASERKLSTEEMGRVIEGMLDWRLLRFVAGQIDMNRKKGIQTFARWMHKNKEWADRHPQDWNTWDFHFDEQLHQDGFYYHFTHCPIADFCKKYGYEEFTPVLCNIDHTTMGMMHSILYRKGTLAEGAALCDYWTVGDKIQNPR